MASKADYETQSNAYELFILVLTILSLVIMVALLLPRCPNRRRSCWRYTTMLSASCSCLTSACG